jgi:hypothetical protein
MAEKIIGKLKSQPRENIIFGVVIMVILAMSAVYRLGLMLGMVIGNLVR